MFHLIWIILMLSSEFDYFSSLHLPVFLRQVYIKIAFLKSNVVDAGLLAIIHIFVIVPSHLLHLERLYSFPLTSETYFAEAALSSVFVETVLLAATQALLWIVVVRARPRRKSVKLLSSTESLMFRTLPGLIEDSKALFVPVGCGMTCRLDL